MLCPTDTVCERRGRALTCVPIAVGQQLVMRSILLSSSLLVSAVVVVGCPDASPPPTETGATMDTSVIIDDAGEAPALVCPGAKGCAAVEGRLHAGAGFRAITPGFEQPVYLAGFDIGRTATGTHDDVEARAFVLERGDLRVGFVTVDTIGWYNHDAVRVRTAAAQLGLDLDHVVVSSTHNHESKDTMGIWGKNVSVTGYDESYQQFVADQAAAALGDAVDGLVPVTLTSAQTNDAKHLVNDTRAPYVRDDSLSILHFADDDGVGVATWVIWGNHPEALGSDNTLITSDYPRYVREELEAELPGTTAVFTSGVLGGLTTTIGINVCPDADDATIDTCPQGTFERAEVVGREAGRLAVAALNDTGIVEPDFLSLKRLPFRVTPKTTTLILAFSLGLIPRPVFDRDGGQVPDDELEFVTVEAMQAGEFQLVTEVNALRIGDVEVVTVPGELYAELYMLDEEGGSLVERPENADLPGGESEPSVGTQMPPSSMNVILNQTNDSLGYIIPQSQWDEDAPFAYEPDGQYGEQNSLGPQNAGDITRAIVDLYKLQLR